jgi:hypothetical protein
MKENDGQDEGEIDTKAQCIFRRKGSTFGSVLILLCLELFAMLALVTHKLVI